MTEAVCWQVRASPAGQVARWGAPPGQRACAAGAASAGLKPPPCPLPQDFPGLSPEHLAAQAACKTDECRPPCRFGATLFKFVDVSAQSAPR